jgi:predicted porin
VIGVPGFNVPVSLTRSRRENTKADAGFNRRQGNIVQYWTPDVQGFSGRIAYAANEDRTVTSGANVGINPSIYSLAASYERDGITLRYAYEQHNNYFGLSQLGVSSGAGATVSQGAIATNPTSRDRGHKLFAQYAFGNSRVAGILERLEYRTDDSVAGRVNMYRRDAAYVIGQTRFDQHTVWVGLGIANAGKCERVGGATCSTSGQRAGMATLGYIYSVDKSFDIYSTLFSVRNAHSASYGIFPTLGAGTAPGARYSGIGVGLLAVF